MANNTAIFWYGVVLACGSFLRVLYLLTTQNTISRCKGNTLTYHFEAKKTGQKLSFGFTGIAFGVIFIIFFH